MKVIVRFPGKMIWRKNMENKRIT